MIGEARIAEFRFIQSLAQRGYSTEQDGIPVPHSLVDMIKQAPHATSKVYCYIIGAQLNKKPVMSLRTLSHDAHLSIGTVAKARRWLIENSFLPMEIIPKSGNSKETINHAVRSRIPTVLRWTIFERDDFRCRYCGSRSDLTVDHIVAVLRGGKAASDNLQTLCRSCNSKKGAR